MDTVDKQTRTKIMKSVPQKDTKPEMHLRKTLHAMGFRYRLHDKRLPGSPDLVFHKYKAVIFLHGCFWHRHKNCRYATTPGTRIEFWSEKFKANVERDQRKTMELKKLGWRVKIVWECWLKGDNQKQTKRIAKIAEWLEG